MDACRTCMRKTIGSNSHDLFDPILQPATHILISSTNLKIARNDGMPGSVCTQCHSKLLSFYAFCQQSIESDLLHRRNLHVKIEQHDDESPQIQKTTAWNAASTTVAVNDTATAASIPLEDAEWSAEWTLNQPPHETIVQAEVVSLTGYDIKFVKSPDDDENDHHHQPAADDEEQHIDDDDDDDVDSADHDNDDDADASTTERSAAAKFQCDMCGKQFVHKYAIEGHLREHRGLLPFPCTDCDQVFAKYFKLRLHRELKHRRKGAGTVNKEQHDIDETAKTTTTVDERFVCNYEGCGKTYKNRRSMGEHTNRIHLGKRKCVMESICEQCGKSFQTRPNLMQHMRTHMDIDQYPYQCEICHKRFNVQYSFKIHMMRHNNIRNFPCPLCPSRMCTKPELDNHVANHNRDVQWPCAECPSVFNRKASMQRHVLKVHRGHKPYVCVECGRAFGKKWTLKNHILRHTGEKPHACTVCDKRFVQLVTLKTHMKMHAKQPPVVS